MKVPPFYAGPAPTNRGQLTENGAHRLAERIMTVWRKSGHRDVYAWAERLPGHHNVKIEWAVKTNLIGGLPPR